ncbi:glycosyltransferase family A protein [Nocardioides sp. TF02-7]|uniref:glycosyltransferase family A protein n=1 Tax=Nocardioides sp. TF02-7 TaxID=2917724 RepID=UPI001F061ACD|nr:glycosyltransferase family A protein [Nocardioides sp. TF02-7]UMG93044.1 glycosyltransferase family 2 protein [Nocardioides sp. TF02-7]
MTEVDLSLVVTAHDETAVCGPTMRSADAAVAAARDAGHRVQTVVVLDAATAATTAYFDQPRFAHWERWAMAEGDLGRVRNAVVPRLAGRNVAFLDADDLFSENWLVDGLAVLADAEAAGERVIAHPELNVVFDGQHDVLVNLDQGSPLFDPHLFYVRNTYDSLCLAPRAAHLEVPYVHRDIPRGLSYQDWQFSVETMNRGWRHVVVPDTIIFKRRRDTSLVVESNTRKAIVRALPALAIDRVRDLGRVTRPDPRA